MTTPLPAIHRDKTGEAMLDLESFMRDLTHKYSLTSAESVFVVDCYRRDFAWQLVQAERQSSDAP